MLGTDHEPGIYARTLHDLFRAIEETSDDMEYEVSMSYLEVRPKCVRTGRLCVWCSYRVYLVCVCVQAGCVCMVCVALIQVVSV